MLDAVATLCRHELFESRVLSRDVLKVTDDLTDLFHALCHGLQRQRDYEEKLATTNPNAPRNRRKNFALEDAVMMPLLVLLDCLNSDGSTSMTSDTADMLRVGRGHAEGTRAANLIANNMDGSVIIYCRRAAEIVARHFREKNPLETRYFTFPSTPKWASRKFGPRRREDHDSYDVIEAAFKKLMTMLERSRGPLTVKQIAKFKRVVIAHPAVVAVEIEDRPTELPTLLHQVAAGPAKDVRLAEWLIPMGALAKQPVHCRNCNAPEEHRAMGFAVKPHLCNGLAVHCAAENGDVAMVRLLTEAGNLRDLNTTTYHTHESLMHIAVKHGNRALFNMQSAVRADVTKPNADGKSVWELARDIAWRKLIKAMAEFQQEQDKMMASRKAPPTTNRKTDVRAEQLRTALQRQRDAEHARASRLANLPSDGIRWNSTALVGADAATPRSEESASVNGASGAVADTTASSSTKKKKNKKKKKKTAGNNQLTTVSAAMGKLSVQLEPQSEPPHNDRLDQLAPPSRIEGIDQPNASGTKRPCA